MPSQTPGGRGGFASTSHVGDIRGRNAPNPWGSLGDGTPRKPRGASGDIGAVVAAWPELPEAINVGIVAMVRAARGVPFHPAGMEGEGKSEPLPPPQLCHLRLGRIKNHLRERRDRMAQILITKWLENPGITPEILESHVLGLGRQDERLDRDRRKVGDDLATPTSPPSHPSNPR